jgi:hypothetical protein
MSIQFVYAVDPDTKAVTRRLSDGAAFIAYAHPHALGFWARHPDVEKFVDVAESDDGVDVTVRVWTRSGPIEENLEASPADTAPERPTDLEFHGPGLMGDAFWWAHPDIDYVEVFNHRGDDSMDQDGWLVKIWLKDS